MRFMIAMKIGWILFELILLGLFLYFGSSIAFLMLILLMLIPIVSFVMNLYVSRFLKTELKLSINLQKGGDGACTISFENSTPFPVLRLYCMVQAKNQLNGERTRIPVITWVPPAKRKEEQVRLSSEYCGRIRLSLEVVKLYDCFGLIGVPCKVQTAGHVTVQPDTFEMNVSLIPGISSEQDSDTYSQLKPGYDLSETFQIREYVPGDSPKQIHWKLSGKFDKLIVRDPGLPITRNVLIFWERTGESGDKERIDAQAETIVTLCRNLLDQSISFTVGWNDTDRGICILHEIQDMDQLVGIIPRLMRATGVKEGMSGAELLLQTGTNALCGHMVYLAEEPQRDWENMKKYGHVTAIVCGSNPVDGAYMFDDKNYKDQLAYIEL